jgi:hypothetical protein
LSRSSRLFRRDSLIRALDALGIVLFAGTIGALVGFLSNLEQPVWWLIPVIVVLSINSALRGDQGLDNPL